MDWTIIITNQVLVIPLFPDFSTLTPVETGTSTNFDISLANSATTFAFNFTGFINVPSDGQYTFYTTSDDGSNLYIDNVLVVDNDGLHGAVGSKSVPFGLKGRKGGMQCRLGIFNRLVIHYWLLVMKVTIVSKQAVPSSSLYRVSCGGLLPAVNPANTVNGLDYNIMKQGMELGLLFPFFYFNPMASGTTA